MAIRVLPVLLALVSPGALGSGGCRLRDRGERPAPHGGRDPVRALAAAAGGPGARQGLHRGRDAGRAGEGRGGARLRPLLVGDRRGGGPAVRRAAPGRRSGLGGAPPRSRRAHRGGLGAGPRRAGPSGRAFPRNRHRRHHRGRPLALPLPRRPGDRAGGERGRHDAHRNALRTRPPGDEPGELERRRVAARLRRLGEVHHRCGAGSERTGRAPGLERRRPPGLQRGPGIPGAPLAAAGGGAQLPARDRAGGAAGRAGALGHRGAGRARWTRSVSWWERASPSGYGMRTWARWRRPP